MFLWKTCLFIMCSGTGSVNCIAIPTTVVLHGPRATPSPPKSGVCVPFPKSGSVFPYLCKTQSIDGVPTLCVLVAIAIRPCFCMICIDAAVFVAVQVVIVVIVVFALLILGF